MVIGLSPCPPGVAGNLKRGGDFNGDGRADIACYVAGSSTVGAWTVALSTGSSWQSQLWNAGFSPSLAINQCFTGDFNGDGKTDLACYTGNGPSGPGAGVWSVALSTGSGWQPEMWSGGPGPGLPIKNQCLTGDFNGDGKTDLACYTGANGSWNLALSTGSSWQLPALFWNGGPVPDQSVQDSCLPGDFTGDPKTDLACYSPPNYGSGNWLIALPAGFGWNSEVWTGGPIYLPPITSQCFKGNFNGDGKADVACNTGLGSGNWDVLLSAGSGWQPQVWNGGPRIGSAQAFTPATQVCFTGDFNGDGLTDLTCYAGGGVWIVALSSGSGW